MKAKRPKAKAAKKTARKSAPRKKAAAQKAAAKKPANTKLLDSYLFELTRDHSEEESSALVRNLYKLPTEGHTTGEYKGHLLKKHVQVTK